MSSPKQIEKSMGDCINYMDNFIKDFEKIKKTHVNIFQKYNYDENIKTLKTILRKKSKK